MKVGYDGLRLRIYLHEAPRYAGRPVYVHIVHEARRQGLAGATVFRGIEGFGRHRHVHTSCLVEAGDDLPIIVEIIDRPEAVRHFLASLDGVIEHGAAIVSPVEIVKYTAGEAP